MNNVIESQGALVNEAGEETPLKVGDLTISYSVAIQSRSPF